jgi:hypothetical protein
MSKFTLIKSFDGTCEYAKVFERNRDLGSDETDAGRVIAARGGRYKINFYPDDMDEFREWCKAANVSLSPMGHDRIKLNDGKEYIVPHRDHNPTVLKDGTVLADTAGAPRVVDADNEPWDSEVDIGNGSRVSVALEVWPLNTKKPRNIRLRAIKVLEHVPFDPLVHPEDEWAIG